jgi:predicted DNA-binding transcriptional regulator AlpA
MNTVEKILEDLKNGPLSGNELFKKYGSTWNKQRSKLIKAGSIEAFDSVNKNSGEKYARFIETKYKYLTEYKPVKENLENKRRNKQTTSSIEEFDKLPDSAFVRVDTVSALRNCSNATTWRHVQQGLLPAPKKIGPRITGWNVGELRKCLREYMTPNAIYPPSDA